MLYRQPPKGACMHLFSKKFLYPHQERKDAAPYEFWDTNYFWCNRTQTEIGPDDGYVHEQQCRCERKCWQPRQEERPAT